MIPQFVQTGEIGKADSSFNVPISSLLASNRQGAPVEWFGLLKASDTPKLQHSWVWIERLRELRQALAAPDLSTPAGLAAYERLTTGNLSELSGDAPVDNPPLLRLLDIGFFNPRGAFGLAFFEEAAHSGFWPGASWDFGSVDSMHFELAEGRNSLRKPGKSSR